MANLGEQKMPFNVLKHNAMDYLINKPKEGVALNAVTYEKAAAAIENESKQTEELSCSLQLKNLLITNLKLLKLNDISAILLF